MAYNFKSEEEVKQFLDNIGTEYRFSCFKERNSEGCHLLGDYLEAVKKEFAAAANVYKSNCDELNYGKSCLKYGNFSYIGQGVEQNFQTSLEYFEKACALTDKEGCLLAGFMLTLNNDDKKVSKNLVERNYPKGLNYLEKACNLRSSKACFYASCLYLQGAEGVPQNKPRAAELSLPACDGGNLFACMNLSNMYKHGDGVEKDEKKAEEFKEKAREIRDDMKKKKSLGLQQFT